MARAAVITGAVRASNVRLKRVYETALPEDGARILVDRLWPRGVTKDRARLDDWTRELAPSAALREWFDHDPARWEEFRRRYRAELDNHAEELRALRRRARDGVITLVYAARDEVHNDAVVLRSAMLGIPNIEGA